MVYIFKTGLPLKLGMVEDYKHVYTTITNHFNENVKPLIKATPAICESAEAKWGSYSMSRSERNRTE
jgi:hypothetical protein